MDEKGFMLGVVGRSKRIFSRAPYEGGEEEEYYTGWLSRVDNTAGLYMR
jgi:hypothetical protein